ncbi:MAG: hypothetical protein GJ676_20655 [Rhodobacteraceae bacterium]|nr:hypothetical protein [Paracoccaceae bacterium]
MTETTFTPDRSAYIRAHAWMAAFGMAAAMALLWLLDSPHVWTGAIGGLAAIALRGTYAASEELAATWTLSDSVLAGPGGQQIAVANIAHCRSMGSYVQVITRDGNKYLIKYQANPAATVAAIERAKT